MAARSTLIVAGRVDNEICREKLYTLLFNNLVAAFGDEAPGLDAEFDQLTTANAIISGEFGLTTSMTSSTLHLVRVQHNPTAEQFRVALREAFSHAVNAARPSENQSSTDGRVNVIYVGQVLAPTGDWLLEDSALSGNLLVSWLDSDAARSWWPQLDKFPNLGDKLQVTVFTPLVGANTNWVSNKNGQPHFLLTHVDIRMVQLALHVEGSCRSHGKPVLMDPVHTASYDGIRGFVQCTIDRHPVTKMVLASDDNPPLGSALSAQRPGLYVFPGRGLTSQANALFALQGFTMLLGGSYASKTPPCWWIMARNLPKLDTIILPDWSAGNLLTYRFVNDLVRSENEESKVLGQLLLPPVCGTAPNESTNGEFFLSPPSSIGSGNETTWGPNTLASDNLPPSTVLYFKLGWGELKLQPLSQRAGLVLLWKSAVQSGPSDQPIRILLPASQLSSATPIQGIVRLVKALNGVPQLDRTASSSGAAANKSSTGPVGRTQVRSATSKPADLTHRPTPARPIQNHQPTKPTGDVEPKNVAPVASKRPLSSTVPKKPLITDNKIPQRPVTANVPKTTHASKPAPSKTVSKPSGPSRSNVPKAEAIAERSNAHTNATLTKQPIPAARAALPNKYKTAASPASKQVSVANASSKKTKQPVSKATPTKTPIAAEKEKLTDTVCLKNNLTESLEFAAPDPLMTGWRSMEQSGNVSEPEQKPVQSGDSQTVQHTVPNELYPVHTFERFSEADEVSLDEKLTPSEVHGLIDGDTTESIFVKRSLQDTTELEEMNAQVGQLVIKEDNITDQPGHSTPIEFRPSSELQPLNPSVENILKMIDPSVVESYSDGLHLTEQHQTDQEIPQVISDLDNEYTPVPTQTTKMSEPEWNEPEYPVEEFLALQPQQKNVLMSRPPMDIGLEEEDMAMATAAQPNSFHTTEEAMLSPSHSSSLETSGKQVTDSFHESELSARDIWNKGDASGIYHFPLEVSNKEGIPSVPSQGPSEELLESEITIQKPEDFQPQGITQVDESFLSLPVEPTDLIVTTDVTYAENPSDPFPEEISADTQVTFEGDVESEHSPEQRELVSQPTDSEWDGHQSLQESIPCTTDKPNEYPHHTAEEQSDYSAPFHEIGGAVTADSGEQPSASTVHLPDETEPLSFGKDLSEAIPSEEQTYTTFVSSQQPGHLYDNDNLSKDDEDEVIDNSLLISQIDSTPGEAENLILGELDEVHPTVAKSEAMPDLLSLNTQQPEMTEEHITDDFLNKPTLENLEHHQDSYSPVCNNDHIVGTEFGTTAHQLELPDLGCDQVSDTSDVEVNDREFWVSEAHSSSRNLEIPDNLASPSSLAGFTQREVVVNYSNQEALSPSSPTECFKIRDSLENEEDDEMNARVHSMGDHSPINHLNDSLEEVADHIEFKGDVAPLEDDLVDSTTSPYQPRESSPIHLNDVESEQQADSTTIEDEDRERVTEEPSSVKQYFQPPIGFDGLTVDPTGDHLTDQHNLGSPMSDASVHSVVHNPNVAKPFGPFEADADAMLVSSTQHGHPYDALSDLDTAEIGFRHINSVERLRMDDESLPPHDDSAIITNGTHAESNGTYEHPVCAYPDTNQYTSATKSKMMPPLDSDFERACIWQSENPEVDNPDHHDQQSHYPKYDVDFLQQTADGGRPFGVDGLPHPVIPSLPTPEAENSSSPFDPFQSWGAPQGLPAPVIPAPKTRDATGVPKASPSHRPGLAGRPNTASKSNPTASGKSTTVASTATLPPGQPVYLDLLWVPPYISQVPHNLAVEFFSRVRARHYIISGEALHPTIGEALIEGKAKWAPQDVELLCRSENSTNSAPRISILPTDEPYEWVCWLRTPCGRLDRETGESRLQAMGFELLPAASLCDIHYMAGNVAFRCEGVRVDF